MRYWLAIGIVLALFSCSKEEQVIVIESPLTELSNQRDIWQWIPVEGMKCRDNSSTGLGMRFRSSSKKLLIFLQGGGACFEPNTCETNPSSFNEENFESFKVGFGQSSLFNIARSENPFQDWNMVYVPYCTGDVHIGTRMNGRALGLDEPQQYVGQLNFRKAIDLLSPYFNDQEVEEVAIVGLSAGAFGSLINFIYAAEAFPNAKMTLIDDSGPVMGDGVAFDKCMQAGLTVLYGIPLPPNFLGCCAPSNGLADIHTYLTQRFPNGQYGLSSYYEDQTIRFFLGFGQNCFSGEGDLPAEIYRNGLIHLRDEIMKPTQKWSTFYLEGDEHVLMINDERYFETSVNGIKYTDWISDVLNGKVQHIAETD